MTSINKNNIEKWLFDYYEGNLNQEEVEALEKFVLLNPEYSSEMEAWSGAFVENEEFEYHNTDSLYQKKRRLGWIGWSSAAVILVSGITLSFLYLSQTDNSNQSYVEEIEIIQTEGFNPSPVASKNKTESSINNHKANKSNFTPTGNKSNISEAYIDEKENLNKLNEVDAITHNPVSPNINANLDLNKKLNSNPINEVAPKNSNPIKNTANEDLVVANKSDHAITHTNISNGQKQKVADSFVSNQKTEEVVINNDVMAKNKSDELVSAIPGNAKIIVNENEFAHLEPVKPNLEKDITLYQALDKLDYDSGNYNGNYDGNPNFSESKVDLSKNLKNSSRKTTSKFIRDLKRAFNNPTGVTNLRDPNLVIPGYNPIAFNPSLAGGMLKTRIELSYMNQWTGTAQNQHFASIAVDGYVYGMRGGIGINLQFRDFGNGMYRNYDASLIYSPKITLGKFLAIEPSLKFNMGAYTLNKDRVQPGSQIEIERGNIYQTFESGETPIGSRKIYYDLGVGLFVNTKWFYGGFSMDNVFRHKENIYSNDMEDQRRAPFRINAVIGTDFESQNKNFSGSPYIVYQHFDHFDEFYFGSNFRFYWGTAGFSVSDKGNISAQAGIQFKKFKMSYQYDWTKSKLMGIKGHSHELMMRFTITPKRGLTKNLDY